MDPLGFPLENYDAPPNARAADAAGAACAYTNNLAWRSETQPLPPILDPRVLFERLFGTGIVLSPEETDRKAAIDGANLTVCLRISASTSS